VRGAARQDFLRGLTELERARRGRALLTGGSPADLRLELFSTDLLGRVAIRGHLGCRPPSGHRLCLEFGFAFEPDRLRSLLEGLRELSGPASAGPGDA